MSFNLPPPPNFCGLDEHKPLRRYDRHLPHWRQSGATYFVTFNLADAIPESKQKELESLRRDWEEKHPFPRDEKCWLEYAKKVYSFVEATLDTGHGRCWFQHDENIAELTRSLFHFHRDHYELGCYVIMANHCHLVIRPHDGFELEDELGAIKRVTSRWINSQNGTTGPNWTQESYDRIIRDEEHLYRVVQYIGNNPKKAGVPKDSWHRWINGDWEQAGWKFEEK